MSKAQDEISDVTHPKREAVYRVEGKIAGMLSVMPKCWSLLIADLTAGHGCHAPNSTAMSAVKHALFLRSVGKRCRLVLSDNNQEYAAPLQGLCADSEVWTMDYSDAVVRLAERQYDGGLALIDPYNHIENLEKIGANAARMPNVDMLFSVGATNLKRMAVALNMKTRTSDIRDAIDKRYWYVMEPIGGFRQWTLMLGSNTKKIQSIASIGFYPMGSDRGIDIAAKLDKTRKEMAEECIGTTQNTSRTRSLGSQLLLPMPGLVVNANRAVG